jgi:hypothetical protein
LGLTSATRPHFPDGVREDDQSKYFSLGTIYNIVLVHNPLMLQHSHPTLMSASSFYVVPVTFLASYVLVTWARKRRALPLPPGPTGYPIIGNVYDIPHHYAWLTYADWAKKYGDVVSYSVFGRVTVVLNSLEATTELLEKRSSNYSDRPRMVREFSIWRCHSCDNLLQIMANELMDWDWDFVHMGYADRWRYEISMLSSAFD